MMDQSQIHEPGLRTVTLDVNGRCTAARWSRANYWCISSVSSSD
jgi:hypothetical protein